jgi:tRNA threonylcarbamoyladenosine biosynthesis protein TsaE
MATPPPPLIQRPGPATLVALAPSPDDMRRMGAALAQVLRPGDTVLLGGDLGAGKTTFTQGLAGALGVTEVVTSPTFVLVHGYRTSLGWDLVHADVWRLSQLQEVIDLAIPELQDEGAVVVVEWGEMAAPALAADCLHVAIGFDSDPNFGPNLGPNFGPNLGCDLGGAPAAGSSHDATVAANGVRRLVFTARGPSWCRRVPELSAALAA